MDELRQIGKFKVIGKLGQGSFGVVYKGYDPNIRREVAIKVCSVADQGLRRRFAREAQISGNLQHKNIVTVFAADSDEDGVPYLVQEFLDGEDLRDLIRRREAIVSSEKIGFLLQVARGLAHAHTHGVIHRDIKPANVRLLSDRTVKIMDFGIAKLASAETKLTQQGVTMGTASYLPPEQVRGSDLDHRADIFSFGVLAYEFLTYERPFRGNTLSALVYQILYKVPPPMSAIWPECPEVLSDLVAKCLEKKPDARFASMAELIPQLERISQEIESGKWPALRSISTIRSLLPDISDDTGVMSQSEISRTARVVEGSGGAEEGREENLLAADATRPVMLAEISAKVPSVSMETAKTTVIPQPTLPPTPAPATPPPTTPAPTTPPPAVPSPPPSPENGPTAPTVVVPKAEMQAQVATAVRGSAPGASPPSPAQRLPEGDPDLSSRAQQIGDLIAQGDLETAKAQLEQTITERFDATGAVPIEKAPNQEVAAQIAHDPTPVLPEVELTVPRAAVPAGTLKMEDAKPKTARAPQEDSKETSAYRTAIFRFKPWQRWAAFAAILAVVVLGGWWWALRTPEEKPILSPPPPPPPMPTTADPPAPELRGTLLISATPWAKITEITDMDGYTKELPPEAHTPLRLEMPPGQYRIWLEYGPAGQESQLTECEIAIAAGETISCEAEFATSSATEFFKESGWWR